MFNKMSTFFKSSLSAVAIGALVFFSSCKEDPELPENIIAFQSAELGIAETETELDITLILSRAATETTQVTISIEEEGLLYNTDYTTTPAAVANVITIPVAAGSTEVSFTVTKTEIALFDGDESLEFTITNVPASLVIGANNQLELSFAEIVAASGIMEINGGGATFANKVFIDLSANRQTAVARTSWDLGFYTDDEFRVILNSSNGMMAYALDKTDLSTVTNADTAVLRNRLSFDAVFAAITSNEVPEWVSSAVNWIDDPTGDLTKTAIMQVSATASENKVYIINRGSGVGAPAPSLGWKKVRILRNGNGYTLQHADINSNTFSEIQITKNDDYEFQYVSFTTGSVPVEPVSDRWDIAWTHFGNTTNFGSGPVPYYFPDVILQNRNEVETVQVLTSTKSYEAFSEADLATLVFGAQNQLKIGTNWRTGGGPGGPATIRTDRFYIIKDEDENYYKLKFTALTTGGERGKPQIEYALVKKGDD
jgi:hypothetical protein